MTSGRRRNARGEGAALRREILEAAEGILNTQARLQDLNVSLREVAREVGVTAPSIYLHFKDKNALAWGLVTVGFSSLEETIVAAASADDSAAPTERLTAAALAYCLFLENRPGLAGVMFSGDPMRWAPHPAAQHPAFSVMRQWEALVGAAFADEGRQEQDSGPAAIALWSLLHGRTTLSAIYPEDHSPDRLAEFVDKAIPALISTPNIQLAAFAAMQRRG